MKRLKFYHEKTILLLKVVKRNAKKVKVLHTNTNV